MATDDQKTTPPPEPPAAPVSPAPEPASRSAVAQLRGVPRVVSLIVLLAVVLLISVLFFRVMAAFLVPLFLAAVLTVIFNPLHAWALGRSGGRRYWAALFTTSTIAVTVLAPTAYFAWKAAVETSQVVQYLSEPGVRDELVEKVRSGAEGLELWVRDNAYDGFSVGDLVQQGTDYGRNRALPWVVDGFAAAVSLAIGLGIMVFALYYFFADGPAILESLMHLSPLDDEYERELLAKFSSVSRAVVLATLLSAVVQGLLAGIGYYFALNDGAPIFLLTVLTMLLAIVPFVGATAVWIPVALWVFFVQEDGFWPGIVLAIYGGGLVSTIDNVIKPVVLHGQSNLHPLLALLSVLGGLQLLGPIGLLVGPMLVAFMQALLEMLRRELDVFRAEQEAAELAESA